MVLSAHLACWCIPTAQLRLSRKAWSDAEHAMAWRGGKTRASSFVRGAQGGNEEPVVLLVPCFSRLPASGDLGNPLLAEVEFHKMCLALCTSPPHTRP